MYQKRNKELDAIALYSGDYKAEFYLRQVSKLAKLPLKTCQDTLKILEKEKILKSKTEGKNKYFSLNLENIQTKFYILKSEIHKTDSFLDKYQEFKTFLKSLNTNAVIIIFGSFAKLKADKNSDLDLFIISDKEERLPSHLLPYKIHQNCLTEKSFKKALACSNTTSEKENIKNKYKNFYMSRALELEKAQNIKKASEVYERYSHLEPSNLEIKKKLAFLYNKLGKIKEAIALEQALKNPKQFIEKQKQEDFDIDDFLKNS